MLTEIKESVGRIETKVDDLNSKLDSLEISKQFQATQIKSGEGDQQPQSSNVGKKKKSRKNRKNMGQTKSHPLSWTLDWITGELKHIYILCSMPPLAQESSIWVGTSPLMKLENGCFQDAMHKKVLYLTHVFKQSDLRKVGNSGEAAELSVCSASKIHSNGEEQKLEITEVVVQKINLQGRKFHVPPEQFWSARSTEVCQHINM